MADALNQPVGSMRQPGTRPTRRGGDRARLCLRMSADEVTETLAAAHRAGLPPGRLVASLVATPTKMMTSDSCALAASHTVRRSGTM